MGRPHRASADGYVYHGPQSGERRDGSFDAAGDEAFEQNQFELMQTVSSGGNYLAECLAFPVIRCGGSNDL